MCIRDRVQEADIDPLHAVLEPSAGTGRLLDAMFKAEKTPGRRVVAVELNHAMAERLRLGYVYADIEVISGDFLEQNGNLGTFDRIVMNPPFQDAADIR